MAKLRKPLLIAIIILAMSLIWVILGETFSLLPRRNMSVHESDAALEEIFREHEAGFNELVNLFAPDSGNVRWIAKGQLRSNRTIGEAQAYFVSNISIERQNEYKRLLQTLKLNGIGKPPDYPNVVELNTSHEGSALANSSKGYSIFMWRINAFV